jgi:hypothetical protein
MFTAASRQVTRCAVRQQCRAFSSTPSVGAAAEVKKLGVIGAGQMVNVGAISTSKVIDKHRDWE